MATIIIVDDSQFLRVQLKNILVGRGYTIVGEGKDGNEGVALYRQHRPDLLITDITMPEADGIACLQAIMEFDPKAKVLICSAMGNRKMVQKAIKGGAKDFVLKPFEEERIIEAVAKILGE